MRKLISIFTIQFFLISQLAWAEESSSVSAPRDSERKGATLVGPSDIETIDASQKAQIDRMEMVEQSRGWVGPSLIDWGIVDNIEEIPSDATSYEEINQFEWVGEETVRFDTKEEARQAAEDKEVVHPDIRRVSGYMWIKTSSPPDVQVEESQILELQEIKELLEAPEPEELPEKLKSISQEEYKALIKITKLAKISINELSENVGVDEKIGVVGLNLAQRGLVNIEPIASLKNLRDLDLRANKISDIAPLKGLVNLKDLRLNNNEIQNILPLINLKGLKSVYIKGNKLDFNDSGTLSVLRGLGDAVKDIAIPER